MSQAQHGFSGNFVGASLPDLIQMECLSGQRRALRVTSDEQVGYLFVADGRVMHAITAELIGEPAALAILSWSSGSFEPCQAGFPRVPPIEASVQSLLLRAAQYRDEAQRERGNVVPLVRADSQLLRRSEMHLPQNEMDMFDSLESSRAPLNYLRLSADGQLTKSHGKLPNDFADGVAFAAQIGWRIGEILGLGAPVSIESHYSSERRYVFFDGEGGTWGAVGGPQSDLPGILAEIAASL